MNPTFAAASISLFALATTATPAIPADETADSAEDETEKVASPEERGTIEDRSEKVRGDSGKWRDRPRLLVTPGPPGESLDEWADSIEEQADKPALSPDSDTWAVYATEQLDDKDRVWVESVEREGKKITITFARATWQGNYRKNFTWYNVTGVNLGKLEPGEHEVIWIEKPLVFRRFTDPENPRESRPADAAVDENRKPARTTAAFTVAYASQAIHPERRPPGVLHRKMRPYAREIFPNASREGGR